MAQYKPQGTHRQARLTDTLMRAPSAPRPGVCPQCGGAGRVVLPSCVFAACPTCRPEEGR